MAPLDPCSEDRRKSRFVRLSLPSDPPPDSPLPPHLSLDPPPFYSLRRFSFILTCVALFLSAHLIFGFGSAQPVDGSVIGDRQHDNHPDDFCPTKTSVPAEFIGPTATGKTPFLREYNPAPFAGVPYKPNDPLETQEPIPGRDSSVNESIFHLHAQLSHYFPNPDGFGVDEFPLPPGAKVVQLHMVSRHGARYPPIASGVEAVGRRIEQKAALGELKAKGDFSFLNSYTYPLGYEILVPVGRQELFESGVLHYYQYGHLYRPGDRKLVVRSTTQHRMTESAHYFLAGFFGLDWHRNATLELIIEALGYNDTLAGYYGCPNSEYKGDLGSGSRKEWYHRYLQNAVERFKQNVPGLDWSAKDVLDAQSLCAYETVALGYSHFCPLFTYEEWQGFEYGADIEFAGYAAFQSPTGRATGIGWVQEFLARVEKRYITEPTAQVNVSLTNNPDTFPLDQTLYFDFSHDTNIMSILVAFGLRQFATFLPTDHIVKHDLVVSRVTPFGARLDIEIIEAPAPVKSRRWRSGRSAAASTLDYDLSDADQSSQSSSSQSYPGKKKYIHFILNQRTVPLGKSFPECGQRDDGWCDLDTFLEIQKHSLEKSQYEYSCFGDYRNYTYGEVNDGTPLPKGH